MTDDDHHQQYTEQFIIEFNASKCMFFP